MRVPEIELKVTMVDMGTSFPLRCKVRHQLGTAAHFALWATLLFLLPLFYILDKPSPQASFSNPSLLLILLAGLFFVYLTWRALSAYALIEVSRVSVTSTFRGLWNKSSSSILIDEYSQLETIELPIRGKWRRKKMLYQIHLGHRTDPEKSVLLYSGHKVEVYKNRLARYQELLNKPIENQE